MAFHILRNLVIVISTASIVTGFGAAQDARPSGGSQAAPTFAARVTPYRVHRGDSFDIDFPYIADFNQTVTVQPDGTLILKAAGSLRVEGLTLPQLDSAVKAAYHGILKDPVFTISPKDLEKPFFIAAGDLAHPGKYDLRSDLTLSEAVAVAGGFTDRSKTTQVVLFRKVSDGLVESRVIDIKKMMASRDLKEDMALEPGDMIFVPQNKVSKIMRFLPAQNVGMYVTPVP